jgi:hypothetical protein
MKIDVSVSIDGEQPVRDAVNRCWAEMFAPPKHSLEKGGAGYQAVKKQVLAYIETLDITAEIARIAPAKLAATVDDVVHDALMAAVKKKAKAMRDTGQLLAGVENEQA